jgi:glycosyltransferase involved in cell wall biosynthesis
MRIAVTLDQLTRPHSGGIGTYARGLTSGLIEIIEAGELDASVVGVAPRGLDVGRLARPTLAPLTLASSGLGVRATTRLWRRGALGVPRDASIVQATSLAGPFTGGAPGAVHAVTVQDLLWRSHPEMTTPAGARFHEGRMRLLRARDDVRVLVTSRRLAERLGEGGFAPDRLFPVRLGVDVARASAPAAEVLARYGASGVREGGYTLAVGTLQPRKNYERLADAHRAAQAREPELGTLVIAGARGWGRVDPAGAVVLGEVAPSDLAAIVAGCRVAAYVPIEEGWGLPPIEALAAGRPVAATAVPSVEGNGEVDLAEATEVASIAAALEAAVRRPDDEGARASRRASVADLTWANCAWDHVAAWR